MGSCRFDPRSKYRWPLLYPAFCFVTSILHAEWHLRLSPALDPRNFSTEHATEIYGGPMQWRISGRCPQLELVALTVTPMAIVATDCHVHREV